MFFGLAGFISGTGAVTQAAAEEVLGYDAPTVAFLMESAWVRGGPGLLPTVPTVSAAPTSNDFVGVTISSRWSAIWDHLIYAYMVENTRIYEVFRRIIWEYTHGERLGIPQNDATHQWLRTTEELFYKDASPFQPFNLVSRIRPDIAASRRNAYYRMFGMDLNHGREGSSAYPYEKAATANREFVATFEEFLREVWRAIENARNFLAGNPTDVQAIRDLLLRLQNMLIARRGGTAASPGLAREEFLAVSLTSWMALTVAFNTSIVRELTASGPSPEERLRLIGERVGVPAHGRSHSYFILAPLLSTLLIEIEAGDYDTVSEIQTLFAPGTNPVRDDIASIVFHWSLISGRDLKAPRTTISPSLPAARPMAVAATPPAEPQAVGPVTASVTGGNGKVPTGAA
jgi:hypothetical protein